MRLTVETGPLAGTVVSLDRSQPAVLGSSPECAICVQEPGVAPQHAVVKALRDSGFGVKALAAGLRLNGEAIEAAPLHDGDVLEIGTTRIAFGELQKRGLPRIAGFRILEELGRGGMGVVYRAEQVSLHREVALKVLNRDLTSDPAFVAKFVAEARSAAKLQHPNVVQVFDVDHDGETYFITMELMHEGSLEDWLKQNGAMPVDRALRVVADAAAGLAYAESLGIVHRDIKPDNLMLDQHGAVKIADLGLASTIEENDGQSIGTPHFMAPEQVLRKDVDHRTDLYALGCTFYRLVTGRTPFRGQTVKDILRAQVKEEPEPPQKAHPDVPAEVGNIVLRLMQKAPADRYQTANALLEDLDALLQPPAKKGLWIGLAAAGVLIAGGAIYWAVTKPTEYIEVEKKYDDPEKQQFADEIKVLKKAAREDAATIALLTARCGGLDELDLAAALDKVAADHSGTAAAVEAHERAEAARRIAAERARETERLRTQVRDHLAAQQQALQPLLQTGDYGGALALLAAPPPAALGDDPECERGLTALRDGVLTTARERLAALATAVTTAQADQDDKALTAAADAAAAAIATPARWPTELRLDLDRLQQAVANARDAAVAIANRRAAATWQSYHALFRGDDGIAAALQRQDFAAAATAANRFAETCGEPVVATQARDFAAAASQAETFAAALDAAAAGGQLTLLLDDGSTPTIERWDRAAHAFSLADPTRKPPRGQPLPTRDLRLEAWTALAEQVPATPAGARECFLGLTAIVQHAAAARDFLARLRADDDASGTGAAAYPLGGVVFEQLLRRLPDQDGEAWSRGLRGELQAAAHLAGGLRALSERRNLAAGGHIDRLLAEHPHSGVVALLP
ncbi:MAG: protein kinase [Planctomycetes bacterium]|nr:protein kinase [Planctomycetota bacterium]